MDVQSAAALAEGLKAIGAGLAMLGAIGAGAGIGILVGGAVQGIARNPDASGNIQTNMILGIAFTEAVAIYALVVALIMAGTGGTVQDRLGAVRDRAVLQDDGIDVVLVLDPTPW